jgi:hypothetical protein
MLGLGCGWRPGGVSIPRGAIGPTRSSKGSSWANDNACFQSPHVVGKMVSCSCFYRLGAEYFVHFISALCSQTGQVVDNLSAPAVQGCRANPCAVTVLPSTITRPNLSEISTTHRTTCCRSFTVKPYPTHKMQVTSSNKCAHHYRCLRFVSHCTHVKTTDYVNTPTIGDAVPKRKH